jgi:hypothetical protein
MTTCAILLLLSFQISAQTAPPIQPVQSTQAPQPVTSPPSSPQATQPAPANTCVSECKAFEKRCKSPKNTENALKRDKQAGRPFGGLAAIAILFGKDEMCTKKAKECSDGCAKTGKAMVTIGNKNSSVPHFDIPANKASR